MIQHGIGTEGFNVPLDTL